MNYQWTLPQESMAAVGSMRRQVEVLLSYDGPALVRLTDDRDQFLGLAVDEDDSGSVVRWIQAPISELELNALKLGAEPLRRAFQKERLTVVDYGRGEEPIGIWDVPLVAIPDEALPEPDAFLPGSRKRRAKFPSEAPTFHLAGKTSPSRVTFGELSAVTSRLQSLWDAFAQSLHAPPSALAVTAFAEGSLKVIVHTDNPELFSKIAREYKALVLASDNKEALATKLTSLDPRVASTYKDYLDTLRLQQVEVLAEWREEAAFVSYATARVARVNYPVTGVVSQISVVKETARLRGIFQGFLRKKGFEFYHIDGDKWYTGPIAKAAQDQLPPEFDMTLGRGFPKRYIASIRITRRGEKETYALLGYEEAPENEPPRGSATP